MPEEWLFRYVADPGDDLSESCTAFRALDSWDVEVGFFDTWEPPWRWCSGGSDFSIDLPSRSTERPQP